MELLFCWKCFRLTRVIERRSGDVTMFELSTPLWAWHVDKHHKRKMKDGPSELRVCKTYPK